MDNLIRLGTALAEIKAHKKRIGTDNDFYQLAHDHIIRLINNLEPVDIEEIRTKNYIQGYSDAIGEAMYLLEKYAAKYKKSEVSQ